MMTKIHEGKYDALAERVLRETGATAVLVCALNGKQGSGFSMALLDEVKEMVLAKIPAVLREVADQMDAEAKGQHSVSE